MILFPTVLMHLMRNDAVSKTCWICTIMQFSHVPLIVDYISIIQLKQSIKAIKSIDTVCRLQIVAWGSSPVALWAEPMPQRGSGHGRPACRSGVPTSAGVHWYPASGWCQPLTVSTMIGKSRKRKEGDVKVSEHLYTSFSSFFTPMNPYTHCITVGGRPSSLSNSHLILPSLVNKRSWIPPLEAGPCHHPCASHPFWLRTQRFTLGHPSLCWRSCLDEANIICKRQTLDCVGPKSGYLQPFSMPRISDSWSHEQRPWHRVLVFKPWQYQSGQCEDPVFSRHNEEFSFSLRNSLFP